MSLPTGSTQPSQLSAYSALDAFVAGDTNASSDKPSTKEEATQAVQEEDPSTESDTSEEEVAEGEEGSEEEESSEASAEDVYEFTASGKSLQFNLNDKERIKKVLPLAYAARDFQARANRAEDKLKKIEPETTSLRTKLDTLNKVYDEEGIAGVIDILGEKKGYFQTWLDAELDKRQAYRDASPSEQAHLDAVARAEKAEQALARREKDIQKQSEKLAQDREESETKSLENQLHPVFNKNRFQGKLGDAEAEAFYDKALWSATIEKLEKLDEADLTPERIEEEFKASYAKAARVIKAKADEKAKKVVDTKKKEALKGARVAAKKGIKQDTAKDKQLADIKRGGSGLTNAILASLGVR